MQLQELVQTYRAKTDEELLQLARHQDELIPEAHAALMSELTNRGLGTSDNLRKADQTEQCEESRLCSELPLDSSQGVREFLTDVLRLYHRHFWFFVKITAFSVVVGYIALSLAQSEVREIWRHLPRGAAMFRHPTDLVEIWLIKLGSWLVTWMALSLSFAAICLAVRQLEAGHAPSIPELLREIRNQGSSFIRVSLLLFFFYMIAVAAALLLVIGLVWIASERHAHLSSFTIWLSSFSFTFLALLVLSRFALAVPAVVLDGCRVGQAIFRGDEATEGKWLTLASLLSKSILGGYVAGMAPFWLASWMPSNMALPPWFPWVLTVASISGVSVVEPTMLIGFALLYVRRSVRSIDAIGAVAGQLA